MPKKKKIRERDFNTTREEKRFQHEKKDLHERERERESLLIYRLIVLHERSLRASRVCVCNVLFLLLLSVALSGKYKAGVWVWVWVCGILLYRW